jgi:A/G-specific adenine glycosylase
VNRAAKGDRARDGHVTQRVERWFGATRRQLPWRVTGRDGRRNAYHALVAETMAQQTQLSRVVERFGEFLARFPTVGAAAPRG